MYKNLTIAALVVAVLALLVWALYERRCEPAAGPLAKPVTPTPSPSFVDAPTVLAPAKNNTYQSPPFVAEVSPPMDGRSLGLA